MMKLETELLSLQLHQVMSQVCCQTSPWPLPWRRQGDGGGLRGRSPRMRNGLRLSRWTLGRQDPGVAPSDGSVGQI